MKNMLRLFLKSEAAGGILLMLAALLALVLANSPLRHFYTLLIDTPLTVALGNFSISKPTLLWINDGLIAIFFLLVGLELKRELIDGEFSEIRNIALPVIGAIGGMIVPALIYIAINSGNPVALKGWAIPASTDIAFALGILSLLGSRVPISLKIFLTSIAIFDDIGAILIVALFYTSKISVLALIISLISTVLLFILNRSRVTALRAYLVIGLVLWVALLKSGVHATLAGVIIAAFIPIRGNKKYDAYPGRSPLKYLEDHLHVPVAYYILPIFAFANSGINFSGMTWANVFHNVSVGIAIGLFIGKQLGVFSFCWLALKFKLVQLPAGMSLRSMYGVSLLCGIGFTMSLFIGSLAFDSSSSTGFDERIGIIAGSVLSAVFGYIVLTLSLKKVP